MFNGNKFNSVTTNSTISTILIGGIGRRVPYEVELSIFLKLIGKKRANNGKIYFNILGRKTKELEEYVLLASKVQNYIETLLKINGRKSLNRHDIYNILGKKYAYEINNHFDFITNKFKLYKNINLTGNKQYNLLKNILIAAQYCKKIENIYNMIGIKAKNTENTLNMSGIKTKDLPSNLTILGDIDYTNLFFILNM